MKERPILFSAPMVRAILQGRKTVTRRVVKAGVDLLACEPIPAWEAFWNCHPCPYGQPGDRLWVREAHSLHQTHGQHRGDDKRWGPWGGLPTTVSPDGTQIAYYREGFDRCDGGPWRPSIHMPRWASRITLEVTGVRVERLQDISEQQAIGEGVERWVIGEGWREYGLDPRDEAAGTPPMPTARESFRTLWQSINGDASWDSNPWVWVVEFNRINPPI